MKFFSLLVPAILSLSVFAQSPVAIENDLGSLTTASDQLRGAVNQVTLVTVIVRGPGVANGIKDIIVALNNAAASAVNSNSITPFSDPDAQVVVRLLTTFVKVHQDLLNAIIGKHGLLSIFGFAEPVRLALVSLEKAIDSYAFALIALIPTRRQDGFTAMAKLDTSVDQAITEYM